MTILTTPFGTYSADPASYAPNAARDGITLHLLFTPGPDVDASTIAMIQIATTWVRGAPAFDDGDLVTPRRSIPAGQPGAGAHVDQDADVANPLYAVDSHAGHSTDLAAGHVDPRYGTFGARYFRADSGLYVANAALHDTTFLRGVDADCSQRFETSCLALAGAQAGTYYGSVTWGWRKDAYGGFELLPLAPASLQGTTATFRRAVELWNRSTTSSGAPVVPLPLPRVA